MSNDFSITKRQFRLVIQHSYILKYLKNGGSTVSRWNYKYTKPPSFYRFYYLQTLMYRPGYLLAIVLFSLLFVSLLFPHSSRCCDALYRSIFHRCPFTKSVTPFDVPRWNYKYIKPPSIDFIISYQTLMHRLEYLLTIVALLLLLFVSLLSPHSSLYYIALYRSD